jgi:hypothetical protein
VLLPLRGVSHGVSTSCSAARGCAVSSSAKTQIITQKVEEDIYYGLSSCRYLFITSREDLARRFKTKVVKIV